MWVLVLLDVFCRYKKLAKVVNNYSTPVIPVRNFDVPPYSAGLHRREQSSIHTHVKHTAAQIRTHTHTHSMGRKYSVWRGEESGREGAVTESDSDQGLKEFSDVTCRLLLILLWHEIKCGERVTGDVLAACLVPRREWLMDNVLSNFCFNRSFIGNSRFDVLSYIDIQVGWLCVEMWWMCEECQLSVFCSRMLLWQGVCEICCWMLSVWGVCACCLGFNNATVYETFVRFVCVRAEFLRL